MSEPWSASIWVPGVPQPKGSMRAFVIGGKRVRLTTANPKSADFAKLVIMAAAPLAPPTPSAAAMNVTLSFCLPRPKSAKKHARPTKKPDIDKLTRCVLDALTEAGWWLGDQQVVHCYATKMYGTPGVGISAQELL